MTSKKEHNLDTCSRKKLKLLNPNPLFEKWLQEWRDEAVLKNSDTQYAFAKALTSLKKYPLPLKTGKECLVLENFGTRICLLLDRKLSEYKKSLESDKQGLGLSKPPEEDKRQSRVKKINISSKTTGKNNKVAGSRKKSKTYFPAFRSSSYAVIVALYNNLQCSHAADKHPGEMTKDQLQKAAQPLCDTSMYKPIPGSYYTGWSCVGQLVTKKLILRQGNPHKYSLTEEGISLAKNLLSANMESSSNTHSSNSPAKPENSLINFASSPKVYAAQKANQNYSESYESESGGDNCQAQTLTETQTSQHEEVIFIPGTFKVILLVDTQEIHKGDELVKALEAQRIEVEVRNLKVGDFTWVSRNAMGQELLLPFIIERKRLDDLASSIKDGRFKEQKFRLKQSGVPNCIYLVESHGQRHYSLPTSTLLQAAANTQFIDRFTVKYTENSHETVVYLSTFTKVLVKKFSVKTLLGCKKNLLPQFRIEDDCVSLMHFEEFNKLSSKTRNYSVKEMFIKQLVQLKGLSVEKALAIVERYPNPKSLMAAYANGGNERLLADVPAGSLNRKIGPVISKAVFSLYSDSVLI